MTIPTTRPARPTRFPWRSWCSTYLMRNAPCRPCPSFCGPTSSSPLRVVVAKPGLGAQAEFLRRGIAQQTRLLLRTRRSLTRTYESGKREFKQVIKLLDATNARLEETMGVLRSRMVECAFRPPGEARKSLLDFLDVDQVETVRNSLKENIGALQVGCGRCLWPLRVSRAGRAKDLS